MTIPDTGSLDPGTYTYIILQLPFYRWWPGYLFIVQVAKERQETPPPPPPMAEAPFSVTPNCSVLTTEACIHHPVFAPDFFFNQK